jgi:hypothetical protein
LLNAFRERVEKSSDPTSSKDDIYDVDNSLDNSDVIQAIHPDCHTDKRVSFQSQDNHSRFFPPNSTMENKQFPDKDDDINWEDGYENLPAAKEDIGITSDDEYEYDVPEMEALNVEVLSSIPTSMRKVIIEDTRKKLRASQRKAYLQVTQDPSLFSQTQINNFIRTRYVHRLY